MFTLEPCVAHAAVDAALDASTYFEHVLSLPLSAAAAFDYIADHAHDAAWFPDFKSARWLTPGPHGAGSLREYNTGTLRTVELFTSWEPGRCLRFTLVSSSLPIMRRFAEDYTFEERPDGSTQLHWRIRLEPSSWLSPATRMLRVQYARLFERAARELARTTGGQYERGTLGRRASAPIFGRWARVVTTRG